MTHADSSSFLTALLDRIPRVAFTPDVIWVDDSSGKALIALSKNADPDGGCGKSDHLAFMRIRSQRRALYGWTPTPDEVEGAQVSTTDCRGGDLDRMLNPDKGRFAIGARLASCCLVVEWDRYGEHHHNLELDDGLTMSWARLDADLDDPAPFTVCQLGPRRLWDGVEAAYDWWHEHGEPGLDQFGFHCDDGRPMAVAQRARQGGSRAVDW